MFMRLGSANVVMLAVHLVTIGLLGAFAPAAPFALFLLALSVSQPFSTFAGLRLDSAIPAIEGARERETLFVLALGSIAAISLLQGIVVVILHRLGAFELDKLGPAGLAMLPLLTFCQALVQLGRLWAVRFARVDRVTRATYHRAFTSLVARGVVLAVILVGRDSSLARHIRLSSYRWRVGDHGDHGCQPVSSQRTAQSPELGRPRGCARSASAQLEVPAARNAFDHSRQRRDECPHIPGDAVLRPHGHCKLRTGVSRPCRSRVANLQNPDRCHAGALLGVAEGR